MGVLYSGADTPESNSGTVGVVGKRDAPCRESCQLANVGARISNKLA